MTENSDKRNLFLNRLKKTEAENIGEKKTELADLLPDGVSEFEIDGDEITIYKKDGQLYTQFLSKEDTDIKTIHEKVKKYIEDKK